MKEIIIIDDDIALCNLIKKCLSTDGYSVDIANNGLDGYKKIRSANNLCLILLDIMLPDFDGFQVLDMIREEYTVPVLMLTAKSDDDSKIYGLKQGADDYLTREEYTVPVLMLTAKSDDDSKIYGLKQGADDYLTKPFNINELKARVEAMVRRFTDFNQKSTDQLNEIIIEDMRIDKENRTVKISNNSIELTSKEFDLLYFLASNKGRIFTKKQIYTNVWEEDYLFDDSNIMSFISKLRKKIEPNPEEPTYILTVRGVGYRFSKGE